MGLEEKAINKIAADEIKPNRPRLDESKIKIDNGDEENIISEYGKTVIPAMS